MSVCLRFIGNRRDWVLSVKKIKSQGLTLVELLVAMAVSLLVILAAAAALLAGRRGAATVDIASQLRDNGRFASELIQRLVVQTGFEDVQFASSAYIQPGPNAKFSHADQSNLKNSDITSLRPNLQGFNNAIPSATDPLNVAQVHPPGAAGSGSDVLILQYQPVKISPFNDAIPSGAANSADGSMIDCSGAASTISSTSRDDRIVSILYVATDAQGEPSLMCMTKNETNGTFSATPLIQGVESFQVLYGVDNVEPNAVPTGNAGNVPNRYLRADQLTVPGNENATFTNWRRVRSVRVGMVLRGPLGSGQEAASHTFFPLGGPGYSSVDDAGSRLVTNDNRLRQTVTFTVFLRNCQSQGYELEHVGAGSPVTCNVVLPS